MIGVSMASELSVERVHEVLNYNPETGEIVWNVIRSNVKPGDIAGDFNGHGYRRIMVDGTRYLAHRLIWFYMTGCWPKDEIDHINGKRADNRWKNLREATRAQNAKNRKKARGYYRNEGHLKFQAYISLDGRKIHLGMFSSAEAAHAAYVIAAVQFFGEFARWD